MWLGTLLALAHAAAAAASRGAFPADLAVADLDWEAMLRCREASPGQPAWRKKEGAPRHGTLRLAAWNSPPPATAPGGLDYLAGRGEALALLRPQSGVTCEAESYNSTTLRCWWDSLRPATFRFRLRRKEGGAGAGCSSGEVVAGRGRARIELDGCASACPSAEETPLELELELELEGVGAEGRYQRLRRSLFWRDLVRPAPPDRLAALQEETTAGEVKLSWAPPGSWIRPTSYFPLRYHLLVEFFGNLDKGVHAEVYSDRLEETIRPPRPHLLLNRVKIRCRDPIANSAWSPWSGWVAPRQAARLH